MTRHPLLDALIVATAEPSMSLKTGSLLAPGYEGVAKNGKSFVILATRNISGKENFIAKFEDGKEAPLAEEDVIPFTDMGDDLTPMARISALVRLSFNPDFDLYVKGAIESHNLPVDPSMDWAKWLESAYRGAVSPLKAELRDEAIHHMLIDNLYRYDALAKFDPTRVGDQSLPLEKQVSSYLKGYFSQQKSDCVNWIKKTYGDASKELMVMDDEEHDFLNNPEYSEEDSDFAGSVDSIDKEKFRAAFGEYAKRQLSPGNREKVMLCANLILDMKATKPGEVIEALADKLKIEKGAASKLFFSTLPLIIDRFMKTPEGKALNTKKSHLEDLNMRPTRLARKKTADEPMKCSKCGQNMVNGQCPTCNGNEKREAEKQQQQLNQNKPAPTGPQTKSYGSDTEANKAAAVKTAETEGTPTAWTVDNERILPHKEGEPDEKIKVSSKYAALRLVAEQEPQALSEALVELSQAFSTLAEASEALVENLDLAPVPEEGTIKEKVASKKKFASALRKFAEDAPEKVEEAVKELYSSLDEIASAMENLAANLGIDLATEEEVFDDASEVEEETGEIAEDVPAILDEVEAENDEVPPAAPVEEACIVGSLRDRLAARKAARLEKKSSKVVCNTESGGVWTEYNKGDEQALMKAAEGTKWSLIDPQMAANYLAKGPVYVLSEGPESFAAMEHGGKVFDVEDKPTTFFDEEVAELNKCLEGGTPTPVV